MKTAQQIRAEILEAYNRQPQGWRVFTSRDRMGRQDTVFIQGSSLWFLKEEQINPYELVGFGIREEVKPLTQIPSLLQFGFRPVSPNTMRTMMEIHERGEDAGAIIKRILGRSPVSLNRLRSPVAIQGPIVFSQNMPPLLAERQQQLDLMLTQQLNQLVGHKYPYLTTIYT